MIDLNCYQSKGLLELFMRDKCSLDYINTTIDKIVQYKFNTSVIKIKIELFTGCIDINEYVVSPIKELRNLLLKQYEGVYIAFIANDPQLTAISYLFMDAIDSRFCRCKVFSTHYYANLWISL